MTTTTALTDAKAAYQTARSAFWRTLNGTEDADHVPNWDAPEVVAAATERERAADGLEELGITVCSDCGELPCCCPDGTDEYNGPADLDTEEGENKLD